MLATNCVQQLRTNVVTLVVDFIYQLLVGALYKCFEVTRLQNVLHQHAIHVERALVAMTGGWRRGNNDASQSVRIHGALLQRLLRFTFVVFLHFQGTHMVFTLQIIRVQRRIQGLPHSLQLQQPILC